MKMKSIFKYLYFNKKERFALFLFLLCMLIISSLHHALKPSFKQVYYEFENPSFNWLDTSKQTNNSDLIKKEHAKKTKPYHPKKLKILKQLSIDINKADSIQFTQLNGIGKVFSSRIVRYRSWLGGFHSKEQLEEVYGIDSNLLARISPNIFVASNSHKKININTDDYKTLAAHPYISYKIAKAIVKYREHHGSYISLSDLKGIPLIDEELFRKIAFYIKLQ